MIRIIAIFISDLPENWQLRMKSAKYAWQIRTGCFVTDEPEFLWIEQVVDPGDIVIDIGANIGVYTRKFSDLVGSRGRVVAIEPIPESFRLLTTHTMGVQMLPC